MVLLSLPKLLSDPAYDPEATARAQVRLALLLVLSLLCIGFLPIAAGDDSDFDVDAAMNVSTSKASPGETVTFWISIDPKDDDGQKLIVTEMLPEGLLFVSGSAPPACSYSDLRWACNQRDSRPFIIDVVVVQPGTEGQELSNVARIEPYGGDDDDDDDGGGPITVRAQVLVVPASPSPVEQPDLTVDIEDPQEDIVPDRELNYVIELRNNGTAGATNVSVIASMPASMVLMSAFPMPVAQPGELRWTLHSLPAGLFNIFFTTTVPRSVDLTAVRVTVAVVYEAASSGEVRHEGKPSTLGIIPIRSIPPQFRYGILVAMVALLGGGLFVAQTTVGLPCVGRPTAQEIFLLHRSGLVLKHYSVGPVAPTDSDILGGMMAAVRMFVEDSVSPSVGSLREMRFSGGNVIFVNGENVTLAAVNPRGRGAWFADRTVRLLREFERANGYSLMHFDGMAERLDGVDSMFRRFGEEAPTASPEIGPSSPGDVPRQ